MKRYGFLFVAVFLISSLFLIKDIYGYVFSNDTSNNYFSIKNTTSYTVIHQKMNLDGVTYTVVDEDTQYFDNIPLGSTVTPLTNNYTGFITPAVQEVTLNTYGPHTIIYSYDREICHLTITDSNYVSGNSSGAYLYGTSIHLLADLSNSGGFPFAEWTNGELNNDYTFTITGDTTIGPIYAVTYQVDFVTNNNDNIPTRTIIDGNSIGSISDLIKETCVTSGTGDYTSRNCTEAYIFEGWYTEPTFINQVNGDYVPTSDTTLYAKWNKVYFHEDSHVFNNDHLLDTGISLFNEENASKDFIVSFIVTARGNSDARDVIFADMNEYGEPYPGVNFRWFNNSYNINANAAVGNKKNDNVNYLVGNKMYIKRENGKLYYSLDGNGYTQYQDYSSFNLYFDRTATFGGNLDRNGNPWRFFRGTLTDMTLEIIEPDSYNIHFDPNGGTGMMVDQNVDLDQTVTLRTNAFTRTDYRFVGWNTQADGSGTSYTNGESITNLGNKDDVITLYAQWERIRYYYVHFDANGGSGSMSDQRLIINETMPLDTYDFNYSGYVFIGWNDAADGSGTSYTDGASVYNLTTVEDDVVTLYAQYMFIEYQNDGPVSFNGSTDYIDTGVNLFAQDTITKDFIIRFTVDYVSPNNATNGQDQVTLFNCKDESNNKWPGLVVRMNENVSTPIKTLYKWDNTGRSTEASSIQSNKVPITYEFRRENDTVIYHYWYNNFDSGDIVLFNLNDWQLNQYFTDNITFGSSYDAQHQPFRFFEGTLSNMIILSK